MALRVTAGVTCIGSSFASNRAGVGAYGAAASAYGVRVSAYGISHQWLRRPRKRLRSAPPHGRQPSAGAALPQSARDQPQFSGQSTIHRGSGSALFRGAVGGSRIPMNTCPTSSIRADGGKLDAKETLGRYRIVVCNSA
jgi:hypothetical protein